MFRSGAPRPCCGSRQRATAVVGKTNLHEFAFGTTSENPHFGAVPNPIAPGRVAGGSSGGNAAALVLGLADAALGSDTGGSIRIPAACCGVVGFKPTFGLVPLDGCFPLAPTFDHAGPMARTVEECAAMLPALAPGFAPRALDSLEAVEVAVCWTEGADPLVRARVEAAAALFPRRRSVELPELAGVAWTVFLREVADVHRELFAGDADLYGEDLRIKLERCLAVTDSAVEDGLRAIAAFREAVPEALGGARPRADADAALRRAPAARGRTRRSERRASSWSASPMPSTRSAGPRSRFPAAPAEHGLPASVQLVGQAGGRRARAGRRNAARAGAGGLGIPRSRDGAPRFAADNP